MSFRADQVGSLLRPPELLRARAEHAEGRLSREKLRQLEDCAILDALQMQREVGLGIFTDGEFRRGAWQTDMAEAVQGFVADRMPLEWHGPASGTEGSSAQVVGARLRQTRRLTEYEVGFLKEHAPGPFKVTLPCPSVFMLMSYKPGVTDRIYPTREELTREFVAIVRAEIEALVADGVPYVQLDAPTYTYYVDKRFRKQVPQWGIDADRAFEQAIEADKACLDGLQRDGVTLAMHVCRGNRRSMWVAEGGYEPIAQRLFGSIQVDRLLLEYDSDRAGGFEPLRHVPRGKTVVLGLLTTKEPGLESQDHLLARVEEASKYVPLEDLALSPQCGFASNSAGNLLSADDQRRKLELVVDTARKIWG
jgi:5-methyltetrahydropteroyltriglutamate--homocysteine methyltransferase